MKERSWRVVGGMRIHIAVKQWRIRPEIRLSLAYADERPAASSASRASSCSLRHVNRHYLNNAGGGSETAVDK